MFEELILAFANHDLIELIKVVGLLGVWGIVFAESGLLVGFFLPGDSLLFTAGFLASQGFFHWESLWLGSIVAAIAGDSVGYWFGHKVGRKLFKKKESRLFKPEHLKRAEEFYEDHGKKTIVLARFLPIVRTFAPIVAGIGKMHYKTFVSYNVVGGILWAGGLSFLGFWLGNSIPDVDKYLLPIILVIIVISVLPTVWHLVKKK